MFNVQVIDLSKPAYANGCPAVSVHESSSLLGARVVADQIATMRGLTITKWNNFGGDSHIGSDADRPIAMITKV